MSVPMCGPGRVALSPSHHGVVCSLEPEWAAAASAVQEQTKGKVRLGAVDATIHQGVSSRYGVSSPSPVHRGPRS